MKRNKEEPAADPVAEGAEPVANGDEPQPPASVLAETERLSAEKAELQDRLLRRVAEFENFRRRVEREKAEIREYSAMETIRHLLPVLDDFERALKAEGDSKEYARGMELIFQRLSGELQKMGLETISTEGKKFDPHIHHALVGDIRFRGPHHPREPRATTRAGSCAPWSSRHASDGKQADPRRRVSTKWVSRAPTCLKSRAPASWRCVITTTTPDQQSEELSGGGAAASGSDSDKRHLRPLCGGLRGAGGACRFDPSVSRFLRYPQAYSV
jgi:molecular chaperone GrpE